jgi:hypothetical protein
LHTLQSSLLQTVEDTRPALVRDLLMNTKSITSVGKEDEIVSAGKRVILFVAVTVMASAVMRGDTLSTTPASATVTLGSSQSTLTDSATLAGNNPVGTITWTLMGPGGVTPIDTETVTVNGNGTYSTPVGFTLSTSQTVVGTYTWNATYNGDPNNAPVTATSELVNVNPAILNISTTPGGTVVVGSGSPLTDTATLSGGYFETGTLTFTLFAPGSSTPADTETVTVSGNGTYSTPVGFLPPNQPSSIGIYQWNATYSGDGNNIPFSDSGNPSEKQNVVSGAPVPEPSSLVLMSTGLCAGIGLLRRKLLVR